MLFCHNSFSTRNLSHSLLISLIQLGILLHFILIPFILNACFRCSRWGKPQHINIMLGQHVMFSPHITTPTNCYNHMPEHSVNFPVLKPFWQMTLYVCLDNNCVLRRHVIDIDRWMCCHHMFPKIASQNWVALFVCKTCISCITTKWGRKYKSIVSVNSCIDSFSIFCAQTSATHPFQHLTIFEVIFKAMAIIQNNNGIYTVFQLMTWLYIKQHIVPIGAK